jgi:FkbM family methyltransferase
MPFAIAVVGDTEKDDVFYSIDRDTGNSKFKQFNWKNMNESSWTKVKMTTVDAILRRRDVKTAFKLMKIDIQGVEILALQGYKDPITI